MSQFYRYFSSFATIGSNYFPYRPEVNLAFERDCKSYPEYTPCESSSSAYYADYGYETTRTAAPRVPQMGISATGHRRTLSGISSSSSSVNPGFRLENDDSGIMYQVNKLSVNLPPPLDAPTTNRMRIYENIPFATTPQHSGMMPKNPYVVVPSPSHHASPVMAVAHPLEYGRSPERPATLAFDHGGGKTKLRSSLKKYNTQQQQRPTQQSTSAVAATNSAGGTPTNPTPPDSLTSDDSSYLSAKDGSMSSQSRVRFSPETLLDLPAQGQSMDGTVPIAAIVPAIGRRRSLSRSRYHDESMS